jgi:hypothetical protein
MSYLLHQNYLYKCFKSNIAKDCKIIKITRPMYLYLPLPHIMAGTAKNAPIRLNATALPGKAAKKGDAKRKRADGVIKMKLDLINL